jgi:hypothetical protein
MESGWITRPWESCWNIWSRSQYWRRRISNKHIIMAMSSSHASAWSLKASTLQRSLNCELLAPYCNLPVLVTSKFAAEIMLLHSSKKWLTNGNERLIRFEFPRTFGVLLISCYFMRLSHTNSALHFFTTGLYIYSIMSSSCVSQSSRLPACLSQLAFLVQLLVFGILANDLWRTLVDFLSIQGHKFTFCVLPTILSPKPAWPSGKFGCPPIATPPVNVLLLISQSEG